MTKENGKNTKAKKGYKKPTLTKYEKIKRVHAYF
jgi:hypothetical protein